MKGVLSVVKNTEKNIKNRKLTRIIALVMSVLLTLGSSVFASGLNGSFVFSDYTDPDTTEEALSYLKMMQVIGDVDTNERLTKGQSVSYIIRAMGLEDVGMQMNGVYTYDEKMATVAHAHGILAGSTPSEWNLSSNVTFNQCAKMLVVSLGYNSVITSPDAYPAEYLAYAAKLGITKYSKDISSDYITIGDFAVMLYQTMQTNVLDFSGISADGAEYRSKNDWKLEDVYLDAKGWLKGEGIVEGDYYSSAIKDENQDYSRIMIGGNIYSCESEKTKGFVGMDTEFVYVDAKSEDARKIIGIRANDANRVYTFKRDKDLIRDGASLVFDDENGKEKRLSLSDGVIYIVNNQVLSSYTGVEIDYSKANVKAIDNNDDKKYDVVFVNFSVSMVVNYVKDDKIYLKNGTLYSKSVIDLSDTEDISVIMHGIDGAPIELSDIKEDSGISVIASEDLKYIEIILLDDVFDGKVEAYNREDDRITVDGKIYDLSISASDLTLGNTYRFRVNENNEIYWFESVLHDCVYVVDKSNNKTGLSDDVKVKLFDGENGIRIYDAADKLTVNNSVYSDNASIYAGVPVGTLVYVTLNSDNKIKKMETLDTYGEKAERDYRKQASGFNDYDNKESLPFRFDSSTVFFYVPESGKDRDFGAIVPLKNNDRYTTQAYEYDEDTGFVKAVVVTVDTDKREDNYLTYNSDVGIVKSVSIVTAPDGQDAYKIEGYHEAEEFTYYSGQYDDVFSVCENLKSGDVIRYISNYNGEIVRIQRIVSLADAKSFFHDGRDSVDEQIYGSVITLNKNAMTNYGKYLYHEMNVSTSLSYSNLVFMRICADLTNPYDSDFEFSDYYCYNKKTKEVTKASIDDIVTYEDAGEDASKIFVQRSKSAVQFVVIVKDK